MKKSLQFILALSICSSINAQQSGIIKNSKGDIGIRYSPYKGAFGKYNVPFSKSFKKNATVTATTYNKTDWTGYLEQQIGQTKYDLQTNASVKNQIVNNPDGTIAAVWTVSHSASPYDDRGSGYNYFNGTKWSFGPTDVEWDSRIEIGQRVGYTTVLNTASGKELVFAHNTDKSQLESSYRPAKGTGTWASDTLLKSPHPYGNFWPMTALGGANRESIHEISLTYPLAGQDANALPAPFKGQTAAILYSRSLDGGVTWDKNNVELPLIDSTYYTGFSAEDYNIDAKGDTVVIIAGGLTNDVVLLKSIDNGDSWTKTIIMKFPITKFNTKTMTSDTGDVDTKADTLESNDGAFSVLIDNQGIVHCSFGRMVMFAPGKDTVYDIIRKDGIYTDGLYYWNENMSAPKIIASIKDVNSSGVIEWPDPIDELPFGTYYGQSLTSFPSLAVDANNNIYLGYSSIAELTANGNGKSYRHEYVMRSDDHGATWWPSLDITEDYKVDQSSYPTVEGVYGSLARRVDNNVHLVYQRDDGPGTGVPLGDKPSVDVGDNGTFNAIVYVKIPIGDLEGPDVGISENKNKVTSVSLYPNPTSDMANLVIESSSAQKAKVAISNLLGQQVAGYSKDLIAGTNSLRLDLASFNRGVYFVKTTTGNSSVTSKIIKE